MGSSPADSGSDQGGGRGSHPLRPRPLIMPGTDYGSIDVWNLVDSPGIGSPMADLRRPAAKSLPDGERMEHIKGRAAHRWGRRIERAQDSHPHGPEASTDITDKTDYGGERAHRARSLFRAA